LHHLIQIRDEDRRRVATGEEAWANDIAWRREDLKEEGLLTMPEHGDWQITASGERRIIEWCAIMQHFASVTPDRETRLDRFEDFSRKRSLSSSKRFSQLSELTRSLRGFIPATCLKFLNTSKARYGYRILSLTGRFRDREDAITSARDARATQSVL